MVEPFGEEWMQTSTIAAASTLYPYSKAGVDPPSPEDFMPARFQVQSKKSKVSKMKIAPRADTNAELAGSFKAMFGFKEKGK